jgi:lipopolysaccharide transport system ATP-binding protein
VTTDIAKLLQYHRVASGKKPDALRSGRLAEAKRLTTLMSAGEGFSYVRLGDKDLAFLLHPDDVVSTYAEATNKISGTQPHGTPGLLANQLGRLRAALEKATYMDFWDLQWRDDTLLQKLNLNRPAGALRNPNRETSYIMPTWLEHEFKSYCEGRRILFCGAESPLLQQLLKHKQFRSLAGDFWPDSCEVFFLRPRDDGKNPGANVDWIKSDIRACIKENKVDTLFLALGGPAKILCQELAEELKICAYDFGVGLRSLTYSGSGGYMAARSTHLVYLYRIPFSLYMDALKEAFPKLTPEETLAKAHAQLLLEVQRKEVGWTHGGWEYEFSPQNVAAFRVGFTEYKRRYRHLFVHSAATIKERKDFLHFCGTHGLTREGRIFLAKFRVKSAVARIIGNKWREAANRPLPARIAGGLRHPVRHATSDAVIAVEGLSKKYLIAHQAERQRYTALRDVITEKARGFFGRQRSEAGTQSSVEDFWALKEVSFGANRGDVVGIIGRNGAGKSTLLKILSRITEPTEGRVRIRGRVASLLEVGTGFHAELTGRENIFLNGAILGMSRKEMKRKFDEIVAFAEVDKFLDTPVKRYSSGMYVRLAFAVAAHLEPEILIVDEVLAVGDAEFQKKCLGKMRFVSAKEGRTVLFVSHNMAAIQTLCNSGIYLEKGVIKTMGSAESAIRAYLHEQEILAKSPVRERGDRLGNGALRIVAFSLNQAESGRRHMIKSGDAVRLEIGYESKSRLSRSIFYVGIRDIFGTEILHLNSGHLFMEDELPKVGTIKCLIPQMTLTPGEFHIYVAAICNNVLADEVQDVLTLDVTIGDTFSNADFSASSSGKCFVQNKWETRVT